MSDLTEFLLARIAEDEAEVRNVPDFVEDPSSARSPGWGSRGDCPLCGFYMWDGTEVVTEEAYYEHFENVHRRRRVLAECEAKRRIVERCGPYDDIQVRRQTRTLAGDTLRLLALPYADHPDYREEWKP